MSDLAQQIAQEHERDQRSNRKAVMPDDIPISYEAITDQWLTHVLCRKHPGAEVISHRLDVPDDGATNRRRIFLDYNATGQAAGLPSSVFCKASHGLALRQLLAHIGYIEGEYAFYTRFRPRLDIEAPNCLWAAYDPRSFNSLFMFDDLLRRGASFCTQSTDITQQRAESQMVLLAKLHGKFYECPETATPGFPSFIECFRRTDKFLGMEASCNKGFLAAESAIPDALFKRHAEIWPATLKSAALHESLPRTVTHNDVHLRNWYIAPCGQMALCDWQNFGWGHWARDVAYTISTSLTVEDRRVREKELLRLYLHRLRAEGGPEVNFDAAWNYYRRHLFTTLAWWTATLAVGTTQPLDAMLELIGRIATAIDDLEALDSFD